MSELHEYIKNSDDPVANMNLARWYETQGHLAPACSLYLRSADLSEDTDISYECMIRLYYCYSVLGGRDYTCENILRMAVNSKPNRPESYFLLSQFYEKKSNWMDSYTYANMGLSLTDCEPSRLRFGSGYGHKYMLIFQKAVAAWWYGRVDESRRLLRTLSDEYGQIMDKQYAESVQNNISRIGCGTHSDGSVPYDSTMYDSFKFKFPGLENIQNNYSQALQDMFVLAVLGGKTEGTYLEIGSAHPYHNSNTALLEKLGWTGIGVEMNGDLVSQHMHRKNKPICTDALSLNYKSLLSSFGEVIDYLQLDIEPPKNTFEVLLAIPFDKIKFRVITYEHDYYADITKSYREKSRRYLSSMGYTLVVNDVSPKNDCSFEDWWVMMDLVDIEMVNSIKSACGEINEVRKLFFE